MNLDGKKLLILGGNAKSADIVEAARKEGVYTIVTDWYDTKRSPAKLVADEYWNEEVFRPDLLAKLVEKHHIDGIITGFTDSYLLQYCKLCELTGLPCYATEEIFKTTLDKSLFKQLCRKCGVPTVPEYELESFDPNIISENFKVIIKPVDNSGSRGIKVCTRAEDFQSCVDYALSFSEKKKIIIERYIEMDCISMCYTIQDGVVSLSSIDDRYVHIGPNAGAVSAASVYPSRYIDNYMRDMNQKVCKMYEHLGAKNGVLSLQAFTDGNVYYFYEMGYRLTGGRHYIYTEYENNSNAVKQLVHFALTGCMADYSIAERDNPYFKDYCCRLFILGKHAEIAKMDGEEYLYSIPECIEAQVYKHEGDMIGEDGTTMQHIAMVSHDFYTGKKRAFSHIYEQRIVLFFSKSFVRSKAYYIVGSQSGSQSYLTLC